MLDELGVIAGCGELNILVFSCLLLVNAVFNLKSEKDRLATLDSVSSKTYRSEHKGLQDK
jgi:hypothetical protein